MAFNANTLGRALYPEVGGVAVLILGHLVARSIDAALVWDKPFRRVSDYMHLAALGGAGYMMGSNRGGGTAPAIFYADLGLVGTSFGDWLYDELISPTVSRSRATRGAQSIIGQGNQARVLATRKAAARSRAVATDYIGPGPVPGKEILA